MQKIILLITALALISGVMAQPFSSGSTTLTLNDPDRGNRAVAFEVKYPADQSGTDVPVTSVVSDRFPVVVFGHGFVMEVGAYDNIVSLLVPEGYILVLPTTEGTLSPSHDAFGKDISFLAEAFVALGNDPSSLFYGRIDTMVAVMGHSMGGGAAHLAAAANTGSIKAIATLAPAETNPSAIAAADSIQIPALILAGENDCVTPQTTHQLPIYNSLTSGIKTYISILGGSHCLMADFNLLCNIGELSCTPAPTITREQQHTVINRYLLPWLNFHLKGDIPSIVLFESTLSTDTAIFYMSSGGLVPGISAPKGRMQPAILYPNPVKGSFRIFSNHTGTVHITLYNQLMQEQFTTSTTADSRINISHLSPGYYHYEVKGPHNTVSRGGIIVTR
jgi:pimeloyl-ACP methyl ester carboxylesterase